METIRAIYVDQDIKHLFITTDEGTEQYLLPQKKEIVWSLPHSFAHVLYNLHLPWGKLRIEGEK